MTSDKTFTTPVKPPHAVSRATPATLQSPQSQPLSTPRDAGPLSLLCRAHALPANARVTLPSHPMHHGCASLSLACMTVLRIVPGAPIFVLVSTERAIIAVAQLDEDVSGDDAVTVHPLVHCHVDSMPTVPAAYQQSPSVSTAPSITVRLRSLDDTVVDTQSAISESHTVTIYPLYTPLTSSASQSILPQAHHLTLLVDHARTQSAPLSVEEWKRSLSLILRHRYVCRGCLIDLNDGNGQCTVMACLPRVSHALMVTHTTTFTIQFKERQAALSLALPLSVAHHDNAAIQSLTEMIALPLYYAHYFQHLNTECPRGLLLHGSPGVGKTWSVRTVCQSLNVTVIPIDGSDLFKSVVGEAEQSLIAAFAQASLLESLSLPVLIFIDEIDVMCPNRALHSSPHSDRITAQLLALMDGVQSRGSILVCGATNYPHSVDKALRRPGRFDREIELTVPNECERRGIFENYLSTMKVDYSEVKVNELARRCRGYVGADIEALTREAALHAIKRTIHTCTSTNSDGMIGKVDFEHALSVVPASSQRSALAFTPPPPPSQSQSSTIAINESAFQSLAGLDSVIEQLHRIISWPVNHRATFERLGIRRIRGLLLYGPPGTGKTSLVRAIAAHQSMSLLVLDISTVFDSYVGEAERIIRAAFDKARKNSPCILFIDEIDAIVNNRESSGGGNVSSSIEGRIVSTLLNEMDGVVSMSDVLVVGSTNRLDRIDAALLRPGRFDEIIEIGTPTAEASKAIWLHYIRRMKVSDASGVDVEVLVSQCPGLTGAEIANVCREAAMSALRENIHTETIQQRHFAEAIQHMKRKR